MLLLHGSLFFVSSWFFRVSMFDQSKIERSWHLRRPRRSTLTTALVACPSLRCSWLQAIPRIPLMPSMRSTASFPRYHACGTHRRCERGGSVFELDRAGCVWRQFVSCLIVCVSSEKSKKASKWKVWRGEGPWSQGRSRRTGSPLSTFFFVMRQNDLINFAPIVRYS